LLPLALLLLLGCSKLGMTPNPGRGATPSGAVAPDRDKAGRTDKSASTAAVKTDRASAWEENLPDRVIRTRDIDFARAFEEESAPRSPPPPAPSPTPVARSLRYPPIRAQKRLVRVMVKRNADGAAAYSAASAQVHTPDGSMSFKGRIQFDATFDLPNAVIATVNGVKKELRLPCTLYVNSTVHLLELGENSYRGAIIITTESAGAVSFINALNVEDYLRGVVPLEIGTLSEAELEALKAQAVAARTYTYKRMSLNGGKLFDLSSTVTDQVYGGANAEAPTSDMAIISTKDLIMAYNDDIVDAYYHSTCGGSTANVEDVWGGESCPYLRARSDKDRSGRAYCSQGNSFRWTETWGMAQLSRIIKRYAADGDLKPPYKGGTLRRIAVRERFVCGRVKRLAIETSCDEFIARGDKTRFVLRRNNAAQQILRSANFNSATIANGEITISGIGYGHGVGMCQVGAIGRARAHENFEQILRAYYSDIALRTAVDGP